MPIGMVTEHLPDVVGEHRIAWVALSGLTASSVALLTWVTPRLRGARARGRLFRVPDRQPGWVRRTELGDLVSTLTMRTSGTVGLTTGLAGTGGFGKTSLAVEVCHDDETTGRFTGGVFWVTVGRERTGADVARLADDVTEAATGVRPEPRGPEQAGHRMAEALAERGRALLVVDDVWSPQQLRPFLAVASRSRLLVTTRLPRALPPDGIAMIVDEMAPRVAVRLLSRGLPPMSPGVVNALMALTGRWPLLMALVNARLRDEHRAGTNIEVAARRAVERLGRIGPADLDVTVPRQREAAVRAAVEYGLDALGAADRARFLELGIFPEDADVPADLVGLLWRRTGGLTAERSQALCARLRELSLIGGRPADPAVPPESSAPPPSSPSPVPSPVTAVASVASVTLHDVVRSCVRSQDGLGRDRLAAVHRAFLDEVRALIPGDDPEAEAEWWRLPPDAAYLWDNLLPHLGEGRRTQELEALLHDVRWLIARIRGSGIAAAESDLALSASRSVAGVRGLIARSAHLLVPFESEAVSTANLLTRLYAFPPMRASIERYSRQNDVRFLRPRWPFPDDGATWLLQTLTSAPGRPDDVSITPDGSRFVVHGRDGGVQIWKADGTTRTRLATHRGPVHEVVTAADGSWLVTRSGRGRVQIWEIGGTERAVLQTGVRRIAGTAASPDGTWLATLSASGRIRLWNPDGTGRATLRNGFGRFTGMVASPDGSWLAALSASGEVGLWTPAGARRAVLRSPVRVRARPRPLRQALLMRGGKGGSARDTGNTGKAGSGDEETVTGRVRPVRRVTGMAVSPDGSWLATLSRDGTVRLWGADGAERAVLTGHAGTVPGMRISPDGSWLATWSATGTVRLWESDGRPRAVLAGHDGTVRQVVIAPDGGWLVTVSGERSVRLWESDGRPRAVLAGHDGTVRQVVIAPDGGWLVTVSGERGVRLWESDGAERAALAGHAGTVRQVVITPDGGRLAICSDDGTIRIWRSEGPGSQERGSRVPGRQNPGSQDRRGRAGLIRRVTISPQGNWIATHSGDGSVKLWNEDRMERAALTVPVEDGRYAAVAPDTTWLAVWSGDRIVRIHGAGGRRRAVPTGHAGRLRGVAVAPDSTWLATWSSDRTVRLWGAGGSRRAVLNGHTGPVRQVVIAPDGTWLVTCSEDGTARVWWADGGQRAVLVAGVRATAHALISPDGAWLATLSVYGRIQLWTPDGRRYATLKSRVETMDEITMAPNGRWFAILSANGTAGLWGADGAARAPLRGCPGPAREVTIAPDGTWLAACFDDGTARVWSAGGRERATLASGTGRIRAVAVSPDSNLLATCSDDGVIRMWDRYGDPCPAAARVDAGLNCLAWFPDGSGVTAGGDQGLYGFDLYPPPD
ncbi:NB-ARC domain-containing protein [Streptosporangium sp. NPDC050855]|uniref:NB-ARC domain-containing protein n=1 Tax=Streptosporangium sp. NPDC050855 TaxID=3366194 RepID=UPI0037982CC4